MKILIIGASGLVGGELFRQAKKDNTVLGTYNSFKLSDLVPLDITNSFNVKKIFTDFKPDVVINPAAMADVEGCEKNPELCRRINLDGVKNIADSAKQNSIPFVFFSSDYIFDGLNGPYKEEDIANPLNVYGQVKFEMENYIKSNLSKYLIVRTCNVFGWEAQGKNFVVRLINNLKEKKRMSIVNDQFGSPTYAKVLSKAVLHLVLNQKIGTYHVAGKDTLDRFTFSKLIAQVFELDSNLIVPIATTQIDQAAKRPMKGGLKVDKVQAILPFPLLTAKEGLEQMKKEKQ